MKSLPRIVRTAEVVEATGLSRTTLWRRVRAGDFPTPIKLGAQARGWHAEDVTAWINSREDG